MRLLFALLLVPLFALPARAQTTASSTTAPATGAHHGRRSAQEHFADANTTHDGHLTLDQATTGYKSIARSFHEIDVNHHGYVTMDDIKAWRAAKKAAKQAAKHAASAASDETDGVMRPVSASRRGSMLRPLNTSTDMVAPTPMAPARTGVDLPTAPLDGTHRS